VLFFGARGPLQQRGAGVFRERLSELGYVEGKTILIEERYGDADAQRLAQIARELAASNVDVIVAQAVAATVAARQATNAIPIIMVHAGNADSVVSTGLITSLAQPGGNVTGTTNVQHGGKHVDLLRELVPNVAKVAILVNPTNAGAAAVVTSASKAAGKSSIGVIRAEVARAEDFPSAFATIRGAHPGGLIVGVEPLIGTHRAEVIDFASTARLPAIYDNGEFVRAGGLIAYATKFIEHYPIAADYVDKILKGAKPAELPVQQPALWSAIRSALQVFRADSAKSHAIARAYS
jgi:putative ABC transport system substrate-binding protein